jgi:hypothetical protein
MTDPERTNRIYVTADSSQWARLSVPFGLIAPPTIELHKPLSGTIMFYDSDGYNLPVPTEARKPR